MEQTHAEGRGATSATLLPRFLARAGTHATVHQARQGRAQCAPKHHCTFSEKKISPDPDVNGHKTLAKQTYLLLMSVTSSLRVILLAFSWLFT